MTVADKISEVINNYVTDNGTAIIMTRDELFEMIKAVYPMESSSFIASDYCYNRTSVALSFNTHVHVFEYLGYSKYRLLGENYDYTGPVYYRKRGETEDSIYGYWNAGVFAEGANASEPDQLRADDLSSSLSFALKNYPITVTKQDLTVVVSDDTKLLCQLDVLPETYKLRTGTVSWKEKSTYLCSIESGICFCFIDTIDECIGEVKRLAEFTSQLGQTERSKTGVRERILDAADKLSYTKIYEAINDAVGTEYTGWMQGTWTNPNANGTFRMWFPKLAQMKDGKPVVPSSKCINTISADWNELIYEDRNERGSDPLTKGSPFYDLIFAKEPNGEYIFRGVFLCDREKSRANYYISKRVATRVKLIGSPADRIILLDEK